MRKEAEIHAAEDKKKKEKVELKNTAETLIYTTEKTLREFGDKVKAEDKKEIEEKIEALKKVKDSDDLEAIKKASQDLSSAVQKIGAAMYQQQKASEQQAPSAEGQEKKDDGNVQEGKFEKK